MQNDTHSIPNTKDDIRGLEGFAGVYLYLKKGKPMYIGKSINVKARLLSHLENAKENAKEAAYVHGTDQIELIQTDSEFRALVLEARLIQTHRPRYNVRWMDDKSYLYIKITTKEAFPKIHLVRREQEKGARYFGPFPSKTVAQEILKEIRRVFPYCAQKTLGKSLCFYAKIGLCNPCPNTISTAEQKRQYRANIRNLIRTLAGESNVVLDHLQKKLQRLSKAKEYEEALILRDRIERFDRLFAHRLFGHKEWQDHNQSEQNTQALLALLNNHFPHLDSLERIECYDVSNLSLREATASMVVFINGQIDKSQYRKFKIKHPKTLSDFDMMVEALERRMKNKWPLPDLIVLDGGKPQVRKALSLGATDVNALEQIPIIGLAKRPDRIVCGVRDFPVIRPRLNNRGFNLLQHMRDEAHRFAKKYHTHLRDKALALT